MEPLLWPSVHGLKCSPRRLKSGRAKAKITQTSSTGEKIFKCAGEWADLWIFWVSKNFSDLENGRFIELPTIWLLLNNHVCCLMRLHVYLGPYRSKTVGTVDSDRELIDVLVNSLRCDPPICKTLSVPCRGKSESVHVNTPKWSDATLGVNDTQIYHARLKTQFGLTHHLPPCHHLRVWAFAIRGAHGRFIELPTIWLLLNNHVCCLMRLHVYLGPYHSKTVGTVDSDRELIDVLVNSLRCDPPICKTLSVPCRGKSESVHVKYIYRWWIDR